jgi:hypothetical protein
MMQEWTDLVARLLEERDGTVGVRRQMTGDAQLQRAAQVELRLCVPTRRGLAQLGDARLDLLGVGGVGSGLRPAILAPAAEHAEHRVQAPGSGRRQRTVVVQPVPRCRTVGAAMEERPAMPAYMPQHVDDPVAQPAQFGTAQDARRMMDSLTPHHTPVQPPLPSIATIVPRPPDAARDMKASDWANALGSSYGG